MQKRDWSKLKSIYDVWYWYTYFLQSKENSAVNFTAYIFFVRPEEVGLLRSSKPEHFDFKIEMNHFYEAFDIELILRFKIWYIHFTGICGKKTVSWSIRKTAILPIGYPNSNNKKRISFFWAKLWCPEFRIGVDCSVCITREPETRQDKTLL